MDETEIISFKENKEKVQSLSIKELENYKKDLFDIIKYVENEINKRKNERNKAESFFKK